MRVQWIASTQKEMQLFIHTATAQKVQNARWWSECRLVILSIICEMMRLYDMKLTYICFFRKYLFKNSKYLAIGAYLLTKVVRCCRFLILLTQLRHRHVPKHTSVLQSRLRLYHAMHAITSTYKSGVGYICTRARAQCVPLFRFLGMTGRIVLEFGVQLTAHQLCVLNKP